MTIIGVLVLFWGCVMNLLKSPIRQYFLAILLVVLPLSSSLCIDMYLPAFNAIAKAFHVSPGMVNLSMSIYLIGLAVGQLFFGLAADKYGRRKVLLSGLTVFLLGCLLCDIATDYIVFLFGRGVQAIGACSAIVLSRTIVTDVYGFSQRTRMLAIINAVNIVSPGAAPLLGGYFILKNTWHSIFSFITIFAALLLVITFCILPETIAVKNKRALNFKSIKINLFKFSINRIFIGYLTGIAMMYGTVFVWVTYSPEILIKHLHVSPSHFGFYFIIPAIGATIGALIVAGFSNKISATTGILFAYTMMVFGLGLLLLSYFSHVSTTPWMIVLPVLVVFFANGVVQPLQINCAISQFIKVSGFAAGVIGFMQGVSGGVIGALTGMFYQQGESGLMILMCTTGTLALLGFLFATWQRKIVR